MTLIQLRENVAFRPEAAASFLRVEKEAGRPVDVNRTTDSREGQMELYDAYQAYLNGGAWAALALHPDRTLHVYREDDPSSATAWDTDERGNWLDRHGWIADVPGEPWHREYRAHLDQHRNDTAPAVPDLKEGDMFIAITRNGWWLILPQGAGKPRAVSLAGNSGADRAGIPIIDFTNSNAEASLGRAVDGWK